MNRTSEKSAFPYWNLLHSSISLQFSPPAEKKSENQKILQTFAQLQIEKFSKVSSSFLGFFRKVCKFRVWKAKFAIFQTEIGRPFFLISRYFLELGKLFRN